MTIRRDLDNLEEKGLLRCKHGGAVSIETFTGKAGELLPTLFGVGMDPAGNGHQRA